MSQHPEEPATEQPDTPDESEVVIIPSPEADKPTASSPAPTTDSAERTRIRIAPDLSQVMAGLFAAPKTVTAEMHDLNEVVHKLLIVGLAISTISILIGLGLDIVLGRQIPDTVQRPGEVLARIFAGRPSGFLDFGVLVLIATPVLRVIGSIVAFLYERDWRYAGITFVVLLVVMLSLVLGQA